MLKNSNTENQLGQYNIAYGFFHFWRTKLHRHIHMDLLTFIQFSRQPNKRKLNENKKKITNRKDKFVGINN
jgi:hypothetical protein